MLSRRAASSKLRLDFAMLAASVVVGLGLLVAPAATRAAFAQDQAKDSKVASTPSSLQTQLGRAEAKSVEDHIATLHARLRISPAQERLWQKLAEAMRASVVQLDTAYAERQQQDGARSAVDDLKSYGHVQQIRADNVQSLIAPFAKLYGSFDAGQKKAADETFRKFTEGAVKGARY